MQRLIVSLFLGVLCASQPGSAQDCPGGAADTVPNAGDALDGMALHWTVPQVQAALRDVLKNLKYDIATVSDSGAFETKRNYRFPDDPMFAVFRRYKHPGIVVRAFARSEADSSRLFVFARAICRVTEPPPPGYTVPVESTLELVAAQQIAFDVVDRLRRDHPRRF